MQHTHQVFDIEDHDVITVEAGSGEYSSWSLFINDPTSTAVREKRNDARLGLNHGIRIFLSTEQLGEIVSQYLGQLDASQALALVDDEAVTR